MAELYWIAQNEADDDFDASGENGLITDDVERHRVVDMVQGAVRFSFGTTLACKRENGIVMGLVVPDRPDRSGRRRTSLLYATEVVFTPQFEENVRRSLKALLGEQISQERENAFIEQLQIAFGLKRRRGKTVSFFLVGAMIVGAAVVGIRGCQRGDQKSVQDQEAVRYEKK